MTPQNGSNNWLSWINPPSLKANPEWISKQAQRRVQGRPTHLHLFMAIKKAVILSGVKDPCIFPVH
jgi:hypothetical protein